MKTFRAIIGFLGVIALVWIALLTLAAEAHQTGAVQATQVLTEGVFEIMALIGIEASLWLLSEGF